MGQGGGSGEFINISLLRFVEVEIWDAEDPNIFIQNGKNGKYL